MQAFLDSNSRQHDERMSDRIESDPSFFLPDAHGRKTGNPDGGPPVFAVRTQRGQGITYESCLHGTIRPGA